MKNKYFARSRVSGKKFRETIKLFSGDLTAQQITYFYGISKNGFVAQTCVDELWQASGIGVRPVP